LAASVESKMRFAFRVPSLRKVTLRQEEQQIGVKLASACYVSLANVVSSEQSLEFLDRHPCIFDDSTHCERIDWTCARNDGNSPPIGH